MIEALDLALVRRTAGTIPGEHKSPGVGIGTELAQLREYQPGDDVRQLDAAASATHGNAARAAPGAGAAHDLHGSFSTSRRRWRSGRRFG